MKVCQYCGSQCRDDASVCPNCGAAAFKKTCSNCGTVFDTGNFCPCCGVRFGTTKKVCPRCGTEYFSPACPNCGFRQDEDVFGGYYEVRQAPEAGAYTYQPGTVPESFGKKKCDKLTALLLCIFLGIFGVHKFYEGKILMGLVYLFTYGLFGVGWIVDMVRIALQEKTYYV